MTMQAKFPGKCAKCGGRFPAGATIEWSKDTRKAQHVTDAECVAAKAAAAAEPVVTAELKPVADFLTAAAARGLKFPKARFLAPGGGELRLSLAGARSKAPGSINVVLGEGEGTWLGR